MIGNRVDLPSQDTKSTYKKINKPGSMNNTSSIKHLLQRFHHIKLLTILYSGILVLEWFSFEEL